mmetsp:Transcript_42625/g.67514  ORF Transcript_42625/g.67514 Transcript_42625/m.67514 type:complete len:250 (-) Transcript_42625:340-1089(-)
MQLCFEICHHIHDFLQFCLLGCHCGFSLSHLSLSLCQLLPLRTHLFGHFVIDNHGSDPFADTHGGQRSLLDLLRLELRVIIQWLHLGDHSIWNVVLVIIHHPVDQGRIHQQLLLCGLPVIIDLSLAIWSWNFHWLHFKHDAHSLGGENHTSRWGLHSSHLTHITFGQLAECLKGSFIGRQCSCQVLLTVSLDRSCVCFLHVGLGFFLFHHSLLLYRASLLSLDTFSHLPCLLRSLLKDGLQVIQLNLQS